MAACLRLSPWRQQASSFIAILRKPMDSARDDAELKALIERLTLLKELENARKLSLGADVTDKGLRLLWAFPSLTALTLSSTNEYRAEGAYESSSAQRGEDLS